MPASQNLLACDKWWLTAIPLLWFQFSRTDDTHRFLALLVLPNSAPLDTWSVMVKVQGLWLWSGCRNVWSLGKQHWLSWKPAVPCKDFKFFTHVLWSGLEVKSLKCYSRLCKLSQCFTYFISGNCPVAVWKIMKWCNQLLVEMISYPLILLRGSFPCWLLPLNQVKSGFRVLWKNIFSACSQWQLNDRSFTNKEWIIKNATARNLRRLHNDLRYFHTLMTPPFFFQQQHFT